jgi:uncharacterized membrane protein YfcA
MQVSYPNGPDEVRSMVMASSVVILSVVAIAVFVFVRSNVLFYIFAAITVIAFLYMAYDLSKPKAPAAVRAIDLGPKRKRTNAGGAKRKR